MYTLEYRVSSQEGSSQMGNVCLSDNKLAVDFHLNVITWQFSEQDQACSNMVFINPVVFL